MVGLVAASGVSAEPEVGMNSRDRRHRVSRVRIVVIAGLTSLVFVGCVGGPARPPRGSVALPPVDAAPEVVVRAYLDAQNAQDWEALERLMSPRSLGGQAYRSRWWASEITIDNAVPHDRAHGPWEHRADVEVVRVWIEFTIHGSHEPSWPNGRNPWSYILVRLSPGGRWLIDDGGMV